MSKTFRRLAFAIVLAGPLAGCVGTAVLSTWEYQAGPGFETERVYGGRVQADASQGLTGEACTTVSSRQLGPSGGLSGRDMTACRSSRPDQP